MGLTTFCPCTTVFCVDELVSCETNKFKKGSFSSFLKIESAEAVQVKGFGFFVVLGETGIDSGLKLSHRRKASPSDGLGRNPSEETFDHVEPGTARGTEVKVKAWAACQPAVDFRGLCVA